MQKPHLACDIDFDKVKYPLVAMPKIDGVRALNFIKQKITGRSLKSFKNVFIEKRFGDIPIGFDGELALGDIGKASLCRDTSGFTSRKTPKKDKPTESNEIRWWLFDYITEDTVNLKYLDRLEKLKVAYKSMSDEQQQKCYPIPYVMVWNKEEAIDFDTACLESGLEGSIFRDPNGMHKDGRATMKTQAYMRYKQFIDFEGEIVNLIEAFENTNEAKVNELGRTERSSHKENKIPKGMVGMIQIKLLKDVEHDSKILLKAGDVVDIGPGELNHAQRIQMWLDFINQTVDNPVGKIAKAKLFPKGMKDKPRFPTFVCYRDEDDL